MAIHDAYARFTPYEISIPGRTFAEEHFREIEEEGEARSADLSDPDVFVMLAASGAALREIRGEEDDPGLIEHYGALLFHGFHFWRSGEPLYLLDLGVARYLVESELDAEGWTGALPSPGGYVQFPRHLFWAHSEDEGPVEPLDGFFWSRAPGNSIAIMAAMGMREDRPGLSVIPLPAIPLDEAAGWAATAVRQGVAGEGAREGEAAQGRGAETRDFDSLLPGGEHDRLYSVATAGEIMKLAALVLWYLERFGDHVGPEQGGRRKPAAAKEDASAEDTPSPGHGGSPGEGPAAEKGPPGGAGAPHAPAPAAGSGRPRAAEGEGSREGPTAAVDSTDDGPLVSALPFRRILLSEEA